MVNQIQICENRDYCVKLYYIIVYPYQMVNQIQICEERNHSSPKAILKGDTRLSLRAESNSNFI